MINGLKKIEKAISPVGKIQGKESFPTAKEKVYSPVILNQHAIYLEKKKSFSAAKEKSTFSSDFEPTWYLTGEKKRFSRKSLFPGNWLMD